MSTYVKRYVEVFKNDKWQAVYHYTLTDEKFSSKLGIIDNLTSCREELNNRFSIHPINISNRGFPYDVSEDVKKSIDEYDYKYNVSYCLLEEIENIITSVENIMLSGMDSRYNEESPRIVFEDYKETLYGLIGLYREIEMLADTMDVLNPRNIRLIYFFC